MKRFEDLKYGDVLYMVAASQSENTVCYKKRYVNHVKDMEDGTYLCITAWADYIIIPKNKTAYINWSVKWSDARYSLFIDEVRAKEHYKEKLVDAIAHHKDIINSFEEQIKEIEQ